MAEEETASQVDGAQHLPPSGISTPRTRPPPRTSATSPGDVVQSPSADQEALPSSDAGPGAFPSPRQLNSPAFTVNDVPYLSTTILSPGGNGSGGHDAFSMAAQLATTQDALKQSEREKQQLASFVDNVANRARHQRDVAQEAALAKVREVRSLQHEMGSVTAYLRKLQASMAQCVQQRDSAVASLHRETARAATLEQQLAASREGCRAVMELSPICLCAPAACWTTTSSPCGHSAPSCECPDGAELMLEPSAGAQGLPTFTVVDARRRPSTSCR